MSTTPGIIGLLAALALTACTEEPVPACSDAASGFLITDVRILDGTGAAPVGGSVRVQGGRIAAEYSM